MTLAEVLPGQLDAFLAAHPDLGWVERKRCEKLKRFINSPDSPVKRRKWERMETNAAKYFHECVEDGLLPNEACPPHLIGINSSGKPVFDFSVINWTTVLLVAKVFLGLIGMLLLFL